MATILIVDDQPAVRGYLTALLGPAGHRLLEAANGAEALEKVRAERPALILTDILMPTMDGYEFVRQLRSDPAFARTPEVIFLTAAYHEQEVRALAEACGVRFLITKPFPPETLLRTVNHALSADPAESPRPPESFGRDHLRLLTDKLAAKVAELEDANRRLTALVGIGRRTELALRDSHVLLDAVLEGIPDAVFVKDRQGRYFMVNSAAAWYVGTSPQDMVGKTDHDLFAPESADRIVAVDRQVMESGETWTADVPASAAGVTRTYSTTKWPYRDATGTITGVFGIARDVTARKQAEAALRESEERFRKIVELMPAAVYVCDKAGDIQLYNRKAAELWGREPRLSDPEERFCGSFRLWRMNGALLPHEQTPMAEVLRTGQPMWDQEVVIERPDACRIIAFASISPLLNAEGELVGAINCFQDVTERRLTEETLRQQAERLQALSRRLAATQEEERRRMARELHDEIGQMLTGLHIVLEADPQAPAEAIRKKLSDARPLIDALLTQVRELSFGLRPAMLDHLGLLPALLRLFEHYTQQTGVRVDCRHEGLDRRFETELETAAYRIVQEALTNVARHAGVKEATVRLWVEQEALGVQVQDRGAGFDPSAVPADGDHCGLAGVYERLTLLDGELLIESEPGAGTQLTALFPVRKGGRENRP